MALINCSIEAQETILTTGATNATSMVLIITPDDGFVVAASDFDAGANPDASIIQSITLSNSEVAGGPLNDGAYTSSNTVEVTVDFVDAYSFTANTTLDIEPSGAATASNLIPVLLEGTFAVPGSPDKVTFVASNVVDYFASGSTVDYAVLGTPGSTVELMTMTIAATTGDFIDEDPTLTITNATDDTADIDYTSIVRTNTHDSESRLTQAVYVITLTMPKVSRSDDLITFTGAGENLPGTDTKIYSYTMDTSLAEFEEINRKLKIQGDEGAEFRIKIERGKLSGSTFTIDATDGIYVFDNTQTTIATAFEPSTSTTTYPSEVQSDGSYEPAVNPYEIDSTGIFYKDIMIPEDTDPGGGDDRAYRFTIIPQSLTTIDSTASDIDTTPDPDEISFIITRKGQIEIAVTDDTTRTTTTTIEYFDHNGDSLGSTAPAGKYGSDTNNVLNTYSYNLVVTDDSSGEFHLPNNLDSYELIDQNYTATLNDGLISAPTIIAEKRAFPSGFNYAIMSPVGQASHTAADAVEPTVDIEITDEQREALSNRTSFSAASFSSSFAVTGGSQYFKIKFFTSDETNYFVSQTIHIFSDFQVEGGVDGQQNSTVVSSPAVDDLVLYITGTGLTVKLWGDDDMEIQHDLDTFALSVAHTADTLSVAFDFTHGVKNYINGVLRYAGYVNNPSYSMSMAVSDSAGPLIKQNITTTTTSIVFTISDAFINAEDSLPVSYDVNDYELVLEEDTDNSFLPPTVTISTPTLTLTEDDNLDRNLSFSDITISMDISAIAAGLLTTEEYLFSADVIHQLSDQYKIITDAEQDAFPVLTDSTLASY